VPKFSIAFICRCSSFKDSDGRTPINCAVAASWSYKRVYRWAIEWSFKYNYNTSMRVTELFERYGDGAFDATFFPMIDADSKLHV